MSVDHLLDRIRSIARAAWRRCLDSAGRERWKRSHGRTTAAVRTRAGVCLEIHSEARRPPPDLTLEARALLDAADRRILTGEAFAPLAEAVDQTAAVIAGQVADARYDRSHLFVIYSTTIRGSGFEGRR